MLRQFTTSMTFETRGRGLLEVTRPLTEWVGEAGLDSGLLTVFVRHTSASLVLQENADPDVRGDLDRFFARLVPDGDPLFRHRDEGADDMPAHVRAALTAVQLTIPLSGVDWRWALGRASTCGSTARGRIGASSCCICWESEAMGRGSMSRGKQTGLAVVFLWFLVGGIAHFVATDTEMTIVPPYIPWPRAAVLISGVFELLGAAGLLWRPMRRAAGIGLFLLTLAVTPCHVYMLQRPDLFASIPVWALWLRLPIQVALLVLILWCTRPERDGHSLSYYRAAKHSRLTL